jgi:hypothetical protein
MKRNWGLVILAISVGDAAVWCACTITVIVLGRPGDFVLAMLGFSGVATLMCLWTCVRYSPWKQLPDDAEKCVRDERAEELWCLAKGKMLSSLTAFPRSRVSDKHFVPEIDKALRTGYRVAIFLTILICVLSTWAVALLVTGTAVAIVGRLYGS